MYLAFGAKLADVPFNDNLILVDLYKVCGRIHMFGDNLGASSMFGRTICGLLKSSHLDVDTLSGCTRILQE